MAIGRKPAAPVQDTTVLVRPTGTSGIASWLTTIDHKRLGILYLLASLVFLGAGSIEAFLIRLQLARPDNTLLDPNVYNQMFTMHGITMVFLAIMPMGIGFANYFVPLMIGARDLAFPRLNAFGYWVYVAGALVVYTSIFTGGAADVGWFAYAPLTSREFNPGTGVDFLMVGLFIGGIGTLVTAMNIIVTIINMRAPGMTLMRMPVFVWMIFVTMFLIVFAFPPLTIALFQVIMDRSFGTLFYNADAGGMPILWQHLFWIFGHPEVYIIILPAFGAISEIIPTFSRKPIFGYPVMILSGMFIGFMGFAVWSHHMFTTGLGSVANMAFMITTIIIGIPTGAKIFNWVATMWGGNIRYTTAMKFAIAFLITFTLGGITGVMLALPPVDAQAQDSYFVVAHFHYVMGGGALLAFFAAIYYWFPKMTGRLMSERLGNYAFWFIVLGLHTIFMPQHFAGLMGQPRRTQTYVEGIGLELWNFISTAGTFVMAVGLFVFLYDFVRSLRNGEAAGNDPWDGRTLEWSISSPPPEHDFDEMPLVRGRDAFWIEKYPDSLHEGDIDELPEWSGHDEIHIPGQSWYPFIASAAILVGGIGAVYHNWTLGVLSFVVIVFSSYAWAFEGVGGRHVHLDKKAQATGENPMPEATPSKEEEQA